MNTVVRCRGRNEAIAPRDIFPAVSWNDIFSPAMGILVCTQNLRLIGFKNQVTINIDNDNPLNAIEISCTSYSTSSPGSSTQVAQVLPSDARTSFITVKPGDYVQFCASSEDSDVSNLTLTNQLFNNKLIDSINVEIF
jgi:hypothetical protein